MAETAEIRLKRLSMRSWRRGIKEMDLILGKYSDQRLQDLRSDQLDLYESLLSENDQDLYAWFTGRLPTPVQHESILAEIRDFHA